MSDPKIQAQDSEDFFAQSEEDIFSLDGVPNEQKQEKIFDMLMKKDEISWQTILKELVKTEQMDPWDIDIKILCEKFVETVKQFEKMNFNVSGKILLASAIMLKMKADKLLTSDIQAMDQLIDFVESQEEELAGIDDELELELLRNEYVPKDKRDYLVPRTPQPRKRKVSIFDLVEALEKALEVKQRRPIREDNWREVKKPEPKININELMTAVHKTILKLLEGRKSIMFHEVIPSRAKEDQIITFVPMLHLANQRRVELEQENHFGPIEIFLLSKELPDAVAEGVDAENQQPTALEQLEQKTRNKPAKKSKKNK